MENKRAKRIIRILILGIILGLGMLIIQNIFNLDNDKFMSYYWKFALVFLALVVISYIVYHLYFNHKIKKALDYFEKGKYQIYIEEMKKLLSSARGDLLKDVIRLNLAAAYLNNEEFDKGLQTLEEIDIKSLSQEIYRLVYYINLNIAYFELGQYHNFKDMYLSKKDLFEKYKDDENYGKNIDQLRIMEAIVDEKYDLALNLIDKAELKWENPDFTEDYQSFIDLIKEKPINLIN